jgi:hypothetical protein
MGGGGNLSCEKRIVFSRAFGQSDENGEKRMIFLANLREKRYNYPRVILD